MALPENVFLTNNYLENCIIYHPTLLIRYILSYLSQRPK